MPLVCLCAFGRRFARRVVKALRQLVLMYDRGGLRCTKVALFALFCRLVLVRSCLEFRWVYVWKEIRQIDEKQCIPCFWGANNCPSFSLSALSSCTFAAFYRLAVANHRLVGANYGLPGAYYRLVGANEMQTNGDEGPAQSAREKMRATPLNGVRECRKNISSSVYNRTSVRVGRWWWTVNQLWK